MLDGTLATLLIMSVRRACNPRDVPDGFSLFGFDEIFLRFLNLSGTYCWAACAKT